jgi:hypothetical protein
MALDVGFFHGEGDGDGHGDGHGHRHRLSLSRIFIDYTSYQLPFRDCARLGREDALFSWIGGEWERVYVRESVGEGVCESVCESVCVRMRLTEYCPTQV